MQRRTILKSLPLFVCPPASLAVDDNKPAVQGTPQKKADQKSIVTPPTILSPCPGETMGSIVQIFGTYGTCTTGLTIIVRGPNNEILQVDSVPPPSTTPPTPPPPWYTEITLSSHPVPYSITIYCNGDPNPAQSVVGLLYDALKITEESGIMPLVKNAATGKTDIKVIKKNGMKHDIVFKINIDDTENPSIDISSLNLSKKAKRSGNDGSGYKTDSKYPFTIKDGDTNDYVLLLFTIARSPDSGGFQSVRTSRVYKLG